MLLDITLPLTPQLAGEAWRRTDASLVGHLGTHFDVMDAEFPLEYTRREGVVFDVSEVGDREIDIADIDERALRAGQFVAFYTGFIEAVGYGGKAYFGDHPQLSEALIERLLEAGVSVIGVDFAGIRRGVEHIPADRRCAARGTFVVENLCGLGAVLAHGGRFTAHTYPLRYSGVTGLPCRVLAEV